MTSVTIEKEQPNTPDATLLVEELTKILTSLYPTPKCCNQYSVEKLIQEKVEFFVLRVDGVAAGCGGVQVYQEEGEDPHGELKRMYVRPEYRRNGLAKKLIVAMEKLLLEKNISTMRLEVGIHSEDAMRLYKSMGFLAADPGGEQTIIMQKKI